MKDAHKLALSFGISSATLYTIGALLVKIMPTYLLKAVASASYFTSLHPLEPYFNVTIRSYLCGVITCFVLTYAWVCLGACIYHCWMEKK